MRGSASRGIKQGFTSFTRPVFPSPTPPGWNQRRFGFPLSSARRRYQQRTSGQGQAIEHGPGTTRSHFSDPPVRVVHSCRATSRRTAQRREVGVTPEMPVAEAQQGSRRIARCRHDRPRCRITHWSGCARPRLRVWSTPGLPATSCAGRPTKEHLDRERAEGVAQVVEAQVLDVRRLQRAVEAPAQRWVSR